MQDTTLQGYYIPKNAMIIPLQWAVHMDPDVWMDPYKFDPGTTRRINFFYYSTDLNHFKLTDRFLDSDGKFSAPSAFIPFQTGSQSTSQSMSPTFLNLISFSRQTNVLGRRNGKDVVVLVLWQHFVQLQTAVHGI